MQLDNVSQLKYCVNCKNHNCRNQGQWLSDSCQPLHDNFDMLHLSLFPKDSCQSSCQNHIFSDTGLWREAAGPSLRTWGNPSTLGTWRGSCTVLMCYPNRGQKTEPAQLLVIPSALWKSVLAGSLLSPFIWRGVSCLVSFLLLWGANTNVDQELVICYDNIS